VTATNATKGASGPLASLGAALGVGAIAAGGCCTLPLAVATLGLGGSWLGGLSVLLPYQPYILAGAGVALASAWFLALRRRAACASGEPDAASCARAQPRRTPFVMLALATKLFVVGAAWPWIEPALNAWLLSLGGG
jgi:mercuric ion transport protein